MINVDGFKTKKIIRHFNVINIVNYMRISLLFSVINHGICTEN